MATQITCIRKVDRTSAYERITHVGGAGWRKTSDEVITEIDTGRQSYYVSVGGNRTAVVTATRNGRKYLRTDADGDEPNNLLSLPTCP